MNGAPIAPALTIDGQPASATLLSRLRSVTVDRGLGLVGRATLRFVEAGFELATSTDFTLGTQVSIKLPDGTVLLTGEVTGFSLEQDGRALGPSSELVVTVDDRACALGRETKSRSFLSVGYTDVIRTMASEAGLRVDVNVLDAGEQHEYLLQAGSDLAYLGWITARCGWAWWVEDTALVVKDAGASVGSVPVTLGKDLVRFSARASGLHPRKVTVTGWDNEQQQGISYSANAKLATTPPTFVSKYPGRDAAGNDKGVTVANRSPLTMTEAEQMGKAMLAESFVRAVTARGTCLANGNIGPATTVRVTGTGPSAGDYLVTRVEHVYDATGFHTHFTAGPLRQADLVDLLSVPDEPSGALMSGLVPAVVTDNNDPDKIGRAKVKFTDHERVGGVLVGPGRHVRRRNCPRRGVPARDQRRGPGRVRAGRHAPAGDPRWSVQQEDRAADRRERQREEQGHPPPDQLAPRARHRAGRR